MLKSQDGRAIAQAVAAGFPPRRTEFEPRAGHEGFVMDKVASPSTTVSPANSHSIKR
jgi:hypothetical protein